jgi:hypothetical protein
MFIFNMFHTVSCVTLVTSSGDNSRRCTENEDFRLSTSVENPVDNLWLALEAFRPPWLRV